MTVEQYIAMTPEERQRWVNSVNQAEWADLYQRIIDVAGFTIVNPPNYMVEDDVFLRALRKLEKIAKKK